MLLKPIYRLAILGSLLWLATGDMAAGVIVVRSAPVIPGETVRAGATEMLVRLEVARLQHQPERVGLVAVGDRRGIFPLGAEEALREAVLAGVPVVKLAGGGRVLPAPHGLFLDGSSLTEEEAAEVLQRCHELHGALPRPEGANTHDAPPRHLLDRLKQYQHEFTLAASTRLAVR